MMPKRQNRLIAIVTGDSRGIGRAIAKRLAHAGYVVFGGSRSAVIHGDGVIRLTLDVTSQASVNAMVSDIVRREGRIDLLVNNAGYGLTGAAEETSIAQARAIFETNFFGAIRMNQAVLPIMRSQGGGRLIHISSVLGFLPAPFSAVYAATKHALEGYAESLDHELRRFGVRSVLVEPAFTATGIVDHGATAADAIEAYAGLRARADAAFVRAMAKADDAEVVAHVVAGVARTRNPKVRYTAGSTARVLSLLRRFAPSAFLEAGIRRQFGLDAA
jgi:NAD(P)-dependent dehydrogenase (short-subunit alcohol dehydrogenase family)